MPRLAVLDGRLVFDGDLPEPLAPLLRSALGRALYETVCVSRRTPCAACRWSRECAFFAAFEETPAGRGWPALRGASAVPKPFALWAGAAGAKGAARVRIALFGREADRWASWIAALARAGRHGVARERVAFAIEGVEDALSGRAVVAGDPPRLLASAGVPVGSLSAAPCLPEGPVEVAFLEPVHLRSRGRFLRRPSFADVARAARRRWRALAAAWEGLDVDLASDARSDGAIVEREEWKTVRAVRWSSRQGRLVPLVGVRGRMVVSNVGAEGVSLLSAARWLGVGKGTTQGMGRVEVRTAEGSS